MEKLLLQSTNAFEGFPKKLLDFLFALHFENTIDKQSENLKSYKTLICEPLKQLYEDLQPIAAQISPKFESRPSRCLSSPYNDRRFSPAAPLKEYMYIHFKQSGKETDVVGLYFDMGIDYYSYGLRIYKQTSAGMQAFRDRATDKPMQYLRELEKISANGFLLMGDIYKKDHYPTLPQNILKQTLNHRCFYIGKDVLINEKIFTSELAEEIANGFLCMDGLIKLFLE